MKRRLISLISRMRADLLDAEIALERDDIDEALEVLNRIGANVTDTAEEIKA